MKLFQPVRLGATPGNGRCEFLVWAPSVKKVELRLLAQKQLLPMEARDDGYHYLSVPNVGPGDRYQFRLGDKDRPDPASRFQPDGVHGPSQVVDSNFTWNDGAWPGLPLADYVAYEMHVGTFTPDGTFDAAISKIDYLKNLGVTAVELLPIAQFPGGRNWGYDGVAPYAAQNTYGGPEGLRRFVNACHKAGLAVILDVVYNHMGPEGNYLNDFGPYFTDRYKTPWGSSLNFDDAYNEHVRRYFIESAVYWTMECHIDALRCDAIHAILDFSAQAFLTELTEHVHAHATAAKREVNLIAESDLNDNRVLRPGRDGGFGFDGQWCDDFHHAVHSLVTGDRDGYYEDFGSVGDLAKTFANAYVFDGRFSKHRHRRHGNSSAGLDSKRFMVFSQNHDQVGNRMKGERLCHMVGLDKQKLAAALPILSPFLPMLFMGEEYAEKAPFPYFISHGEAALVDAVRKGRKDEFKAFSWAGEPPDPQSEETYASARLDWSLHEQGAHATLLDFYRTLLKVRKETPALRNLSREFLEVGSTEAPPVFWARRWFGRSEVFMAFNLGADAVNCPLPAGRWKKLMDSADTRWGGPGGSTAESVFSEGDASLALGPSSFVLVSRLKET